MKKAHFTKKTLFKLATLIAVPVLYVLLFTGFKGETNPRPESLEQPKIVTTNQGKDFVNFILNNDHMTTTNSGMWVESQLGNYYDTLHFNGIHIYDVVGGGTSGTDYGTARFGYFNETLTPGQLSEINTLAGNIDAEDLKLYWERVKISRLCYAQRLVYEVSQNNNTTNYGFCYQSCNGEYMTDNGRTVLHADPNEMTSGTYLAQNIFENMQHGDNANWNPQRADALIWYMKPMMRIDSSVVDNTPEAEVVRIDVVNFRGQAVKSVTIKARNFAQFTGGNYLYDGKYVDIFNFIQDPGTNLEVSGDTNRFVDATGLNNGVYGNQYYNRHWSEWEDSCRVDFKVWWFGDVEVWFDKMTVDDRDANGLFTGIYDPYITDETSSGMFLLTAFMVKDKNYKESNRLAFNYVMNRMFDNLQTKAMPSSLKTP